VCSEQKWNKERMIENSQKPFVILITKGGITQIWQICAATNFYFAELAPIYQQA
jgi:hypothetical protein